ncbi:hypothetical protein BH10ACT11_BH10ACT11_15900 [soil metagenome]
MSEDRKPPRYEEAERSFRELLEHAELPAPDEVLVETEAEELLFLWNGPKIAIVLDLGADGESDQNCARTNELFDRLDFDLDPARDPDPADAGCFGTFESVDEVTSLGDFGGFRAPPERLM